MSNQKEWVKVAHVKLRRRLRKTQASFRAVGAEIDVVVAGGYYQGDAHPACITATTPQGKEYVMHEPLSVVETMLEPLK